MNLYIIVDNFIKVLSKFNITIYLLKFLNSLKNYINEVNIKNMIIRIIFYYKIIIKYILNNLFTISIMYLNDVFFSFFKWIPLNNNYVVKKKSYEIINNNNNIFLLNYFNTHVEYKPGTFKIVIAWVNFNETYIKNKVIMLTNILHSIYSINNQLTMKDLKTILYNYNNVNNVYIIFNINDKLYVKIIDYKNNTYNDNSKIMFDRIFYQNNNDSDSESDSESKNSFYYF